MLSAISTLNKWCRTKLNHFNEGLRGYRRRKEYEEWLRSGKPLPPPHLAKQAVLKEYAAKHGTRTLVETGTFMGDMVEAMRGTFDTIYSIELSQEFFAAAQRRFADCPEVELLQGDSGKVLGELLPNLNEPALLWLDGHYSAGATARGDKDTPILEELAHVLRAIAKQPGHIVLIDDARCFGTFDGYPSLQKLQDFLREQGAQFDLEVADDVIRITSIRTDNTANAA